jgi:hypothetical protein
VVAGLANTARVITSAAAIMIAVALGFALDPTVMVKIVGVGMAAAILVDVTIARLILVPAAMTLLGRWNWYLPGRPAGNALGIGNRVDTHRKTRPTRDRVSYSGKLSTRWRPADQVHQPTGLG